MQPNVIPMEPRTGSVRRFPAHRIVRRTPTQAEAVARAFEAARGLHCPPRPLRVEWMPAPSFAERAGKLWRDPVVQAAVILAIGLPVITWVFAL